MNWIPIDEVFYFDVVTHNPTTGAIANVDGTTTGTFSVFEENNNTPIINTQALITRSLTGQYYGTFTVSAANGFEVGRYYSVIASATVNSIAGKSVAASFWCIPATAQTGYPLVDVGALSGDTAAANNAESFFDGTGYAGTNNVIPTVTTVTNQVTANVTALSGDSAAADNAESFFDGTGYAGTNNVIPTVTTVTNQVTANVTAVSGDTTAADNLELQYDGTGLTGETFPASQAQVSAIRVGSSPAYKSPAAFVLTTGIEDSGTYESVSNENGIYHTLTDDTGSITGTYTYQLTSDSVAAGVLFAGYLNSSNDSVIFQAFNYVTAAFENIFTLTGQNGSTDQVINSALDTKFTGTGGSIGEVQIRVIGTGLTTATLNIDQLLVSFSTVVRSVGYAIGRVWVDTNDGAAGTTAFVNGVADNPVGSLSDALTIATGLNIHDFNIANSSLVTLAAPMQYNNMFGFGWILNLAGQDISGLSVHNAVVLGNASGTFPAFEGCLITSGTYPPSFFLDCGFDDYFATGGDSTLGYEYTLINCHSDVPGSSTPTFDFLSTIGATNMNIRRWSGGLNLINLSAGDVVSVDVISGGTISVNGSGGTVNIRGMVSAVVDNSGGNVTINENAAINMSKINAEVVDTWNTDTVSQPGQEAPAATQTRQGMLAYLYKAWRNRSTSDFTAGRHDLYNDDAVTVDQSAAIADDGTTFDRGKVGSGA